MEDTYKEILANAFARDTNYVIIKRTDNLEDLEDMWNRFNSNMTNRQKRLSDDKCIDIYNMTNQQHYEHLKAELMDAESKTKKIENPKQDEINNDELKDVIDDKTDSINTDIDPDIPDIMNSLIIESDSDVGEAELDIGEYRDYTNHEVERYNVETNISIIGNIENDNPEEALKELEDEFIKFNSQSNDLKRKSDDKCRELFGFSNLERYNKMKAEILSKLSEEKDKVLKPVSVLNRKLDCVKEDCSLASSFVEKCYAEKILNEAKESRKKAKRFNDTPYFTPTELIDLGVHGNGNYYSSTPDNDGLTKDISINTWFDSYINNISDRIYEDYTKEWIDKMTELYLDYNQIKESGDVEKINARKQSILDLGWNPEIDFSPINRKKASKRVSEIIEHTIPKDVFIKLDDIVIDDENFNINEAVSDSYSPVFLILTKGETPIISDGIRFFTKSDYTHTSISFDPELKDVYSFNMVGKNSGLVRENIFAKNLFVKVYCFFTDNDSVNRMNKAIYDFKTHKTSYDLEIFIAKIAKTNIKLKDDYNQVCSTFVDSILKVGNINITDNKLPSPADIHDGIKNNSNKIFEIFSGLTSKYNSREVKRKLKYLQKNPTILGIKNESAELVTDTNSSSSIVVNEVKQFPIEFDKDGNLIIYKCNTNNIDYGDEIQESVELLASYRDSGNEEGMKYELAKIWFIIDNIEKRMKKCDTIKDKEEYNKLMKTRAIASNVFKFNIKHLMKMDPKFNFGNYYNSTPFSDNGVKISANTLKYSIQALKTFLA